MPFALAFALALDKALALAAGGRQMLAVSSPCTASGGAGVGGSTVGSDGVDGSTGVGAVGSDGVGVGVGTVSELVPLLVPLLVLDIAARSRCTALVSGKKAATEAVSKSET